MQRIGWLILIATLFLAAQAGLRGAVPMDKGNVTTLDGGGGQPPPTKAP